MIGNPEAGEWDESVCIPFDHYKDVFEQKYGGLPCPESCLADLAIENHPLTLRDNLVVQITASYAKGSGDFLLAVKHEGQAFCQVNAPALKNFGSGFSLIFVPPGANYPVSITVML